VSGPLPGGVTRHSPNFARRLASHELLGPQALAAEKILTRQPPRAGAAEVSPHGPPPCHLPRQSGYYPFRLASAPFGCRAFFPFQTRAPERTIVSGVGEFTPPPSPSLRERACRRRRRTGCLSRLTRATRPRRPCPFWRI